MLALMGDSIDNIKGVPGIGEKGARDLIAKYGDLENAARARRRGPEQAPARRAAQPRGRRAAEPHAGAHPRRLPGGVRSRVDALPRRLARALLSSCSPGSVSATLVMDYAPTAETVARDLRDRRHTEGLTSAHWRRDLRAAGAVSRCACCPTRRRRCARRSSVCRSRRAAPRALRTVHGRAPPVAVGVNGGFAFDTSLMPPAASTRRRAEAGARRPADPQDRPRPQVRRHRARAARRQPRRARDRHDDRELPGRRDAVVASAGGAGARAHRLQGADRGRRLRPRRQGDLVREDPGADGAWTTPASDPTWRCSSRRRCGRS